MFDFVVVSLALVALGPVNMPINALRVLAAKELRRRRRRRNGKSCNRQSDAARESAHPTPHILP